MNNVTVNEDGSVTHNVFKAKDGSGEPRKFKDVETFKRWVAKHPRERKEDLKGRLTPQQFYVTQGAGTERPFTGQLWWNKDVGVYSCVCCSQRLFMSEHKYENPSGYPTFWNHVIDSVVFKDDNLQLPKVTNAHVDTLLKNKEAVKRCVCSNCEAHLGHVFADGPAPFGKRFQVNSASLSFLGKPWQEAPRHTFEERVAKMKRQAETKYAFTQFQALLEQEKLLNIVPSKQAVGAEEVKPMFNLKGAAYGGLNFSAKDFKKQ